MPVTDETHTSPAVSHVRHQRQRCCSNGDNNPRRNTQRQKGRARHVQPSWTGQPTARGRELVALSNITRYVIHPHTEADSDGRGAPSNATNTPFPVAGKTHCMQSRPAPAKLSLPPLHSWTSPSTTHSAAGCNDKLQTGQSSQPRTGSGNSWHKRSRDTRSCLYTVQTEDRERS